MITNAYLAAILAEFGEPLLVPAHVMLFEFGATANGAYIVKSGSVDVVMLNPRGAPVWKRSISDGGILGLPPSIGKFPHYVRAIVSCEAEVVFVPVVEVVMLIQVNAGIGTQLLVAMKEELINVRRQYTTLNIPVRSQRVN